MTQLQLYIRLAWRNVWRHRRRTIIVLLAIGLTMMMMFYDGLIADCSVIAAPSTDILEDAPELGK